MAYWKYLVIAIVLLIGSFYTLPNFFGNDPGMQIRGTRGVTVSENTLERVDAALNSASIIVKALVIDKKGISIRFKDTEDQLKAKEIVESALGNDFTTALTLLSGAPKWLTRARANPMYLGLDLRGGIHFLLEVDMESTIARALDRYENDIKTVLREENIRYHSIHQNTGQELEVTIRNPEELEDAFRVIRNELPELNVMESLKKSEILLVTLSELQIEEIKTFALKQNMTAFRHRIDQLGVAEPIIQQQGDDRIVIQLPGVQDTARAKRILGRTATLEMHLVDEKRTVSAVRSGQAPAGTRLYRFRDGQHILLEKRVLYSGDNIIDATVSLDTQTGSPVVNITLDGSAARINQRVTGKNIGNRMAVVYIEITSETKKDENGNVILDDNGELVRISNRIEEVLTAPVIRDQLGKRYQIEGMNTVDEARDLSLMLRSGVLAAPVEIIEERTVGPSLGQKNISQGFSSIIAGFVLVLIFMLFYYRILGIAASITLTVNLVLLVAVLSLLQATLTLPGVAGIVLTVGMAVDANVLIFERIREEIRNGNSPQASIYLGYDRALSTIIDANITTLIAAILLFNFGTGPIKGFAVTLSIGIGTSMFTAIMLTRAIMRLFHSGTIIKTLKI